MTTWTELEHGWEHANPKVTHPWTRTQAEEAIRRISRRHRCGTPQLTVNPRLTTAEGQYTPGRITIPSLPVPRCVIWHEMAHHATRRVVEPQHGPSFQRWWLRIITAEAGTRIADDLQRRLH